MSSITQAVCPAAAPARPPRPSATIVVVRDGASGIEVLLARRAERGDYNSGAWVFPGGLVDASDTSSSAACAGLSEADADAALHLPHDGLAFYLAATRECFEECGLLFGIDAAGEPVSASVAQTLQGWRESIYRGEKSALAFARETGIRFDVGRLVYLSHWITPLGRVKRFDTRFFVAEAPVGQVAAHDGTEMTDHRWIRPSDALVAGDALKLMGPTRATLMTLQRFESAASVLDWARSPRDIPLIFPRIANGPQGERHVLPEEHSCAEIGRLDPQDLGTASYDIVPGRPVRLSSRIIRVTASNASVMTGPGTNSYLVGGGARNEWAVIDPGPVDATHVQAIIDAAPGRITRIFATHTHSDHSPGAALLKSRTDAITLGRVADHPDRQDKTFIPDVALAGGESIEIDEGVTLRVIHTPGHASNHLCYLLEEEKTLFTGDHVMQSSTVVINPPDGDMAAYIASLRSLAADADGRIDWLAPGHGFLMEQPERAFEWIVQHRLKREAKIIDALQMLGPASADALIDRVYDDVTAQLHGIAMRSLLAHLYKLRDEGRAIEVDGTWSLRTT